MPCRRALLIGVGGCTAWLQTPEPIVDVTIDARRPTVDAVYFGGPDQPVGRLRQLLLDRIRATPPGQSIDWATDYFLDPNSPAR